MQIGHYQLGDELGAGGMGVVYRATDTRLNQTVAIKKLKADIATPKTVERFRREGEALRDLNHPNIVKMLDMFEHDRQHYLVIEYVSGGDLSALIKQDDIPVEKCVDMAIDLADALTRAHRLDIIHRDLKPANVLIGDDGVLRLTDFGVAHVGSKDRVTDTDAIVGTIDYLPPEAFDGIFDARGDIWAFGVMLFEMLSAQRPFAGQTIMEVLQNITTAPIPDLEALQPSAPIALVDLIYRMLERDRRVRIPSARIVGAELERIQQGYSDQPIRYLFDTSTSDFITLPKHNIPAPTTPFIGRKHELDQLKHMLVNESRRLITIVAPGGMGKTRLAIETGRLALNKFNQQVYMISLVSLNDSVGIVSTIADTLQYTFQNDERSPKQQLLDYLANKQCVLILDNFEHILDSSYLVTEILENAPNLHIMVTSRSALQQPGETIVNLSGMRYPQSQPTVDMNAYPAMQLFVSSARRVQTNFVLDDNNIADVVQICNIVQGMPLGIVLAASWLGILTTQEIVSELKTSIQILEVDDSDLPVRQRSMRVVLNYTWQTMTPKEQDVFMKASLFGGGFTREAVQSLTGANLKTLMALAQKSVLHRDSQTGRYAIHGLLRQYAWEHLEQSGELDAMSERHMMYYTEYLTTYEKEFRNSGHLLSSMRDIEQEIDNIQQAWRYATDNQKMRVIDDLMAGLFHFYDARGWIVKGEQVFKESAQLVRQHMTDQHVILAKLLCRQAKFSFYQGNHDYALNAMQESINLLQNTDEDDERAFALSIYADALVYMGDFEVAKKLCESSLVIFRKKNDKWGIASALNNLGVANYYLGEYNEAIKHYDESIVISRGIGDLPGVSAILSNRGAIAHEQEHYDDAIAFYRESMDISERLHDRYGMASTQLNLGWTMYVTGNYDEAHQYTMQSINTAEQLGNRWLLVTAYLNMGIIACELDELVTAQSYLKQSYQDAIELGGLHLMPDIVYGTGNWLIKSQRYDEAYNLLVLGKDMTDIERETKQRVEHLISFLRDKNIEDNSILSDNISVENILSNILK